MNFLLDKLAFCKCFTSIIVSQRFVCMSCDVWCGVWMCERASKQK